MKLPERGLWGRWKWSWNLKDELLGFSSKKVMEQFGRAHDRARAGGQSLTCIYIKEERGQRLVS